MKSFLKFRTLAATLLALAGSLVTPAAAQAYYMPDYWFMPHGLRANLFTVFKTGGIHNCPGGTTTATHAFWRGSFLGRTVALQGGTPFDQPQSAYDIFEETANSIKYWGTFRGNALASASAYSNAFSTALTFMPNNMSVGDSTSSSVTDNEMFNNHRKKTQSATFTHKLTVEAQIASFFDGESGRTWTDVLKVRFTQPGGDEVYWLARGKGTVRFESYDANEPSCVDHQYATSFQNYAPEAVPSLPWYDPFNFGTYVPNGFFEDHLKAPVNGGWPLKGYERSWTGYSPPGLSTLEDVAITKDAPNASTTTWKVVLRVLPTGGWDYAISDSIPVIANKTYRLSGWLYRVSSSDQVYLDFNDIPGDVNIAATSTNAWQCVKGQVNVGSATSIRVRCVRDAESAGNAYCDGITLQRVK